MCEAWYLMLGESELFTVSLRSTYDLDVLFYLGY
jgi:hypothetical protein